jgi:hypothetical protein
MCVRRLKEMASSNVSRYRSPKNISEKTRFAGHRVAGIGDAPVAA